MAGLKGLPVKYVGRAEVCKVAIEQTSSPIYCWNGGIWTGTTNHYGEGIFWACYAAIGPSQLAVIELIINSSE